jgi:hypothetical protein
MSYIADIADYLAIRSRSPASPGPEAYTRIAEWEKRGIPSGIVLSSITDVCGKIGEATCEIELVDRLDEVVRANFRAWLSGSAGQAESHVT